MNKLIILTIFIPLCLSACSNLCQTCKDNNTNNNPYACQSCYPNNSQGYIFSCPSVSQDLNKFIAPVIVIIFLHFFMLSVGMGVYRDIFENIQIAALISWRYNFQKGAIAVQATNLGIVTSSNFMTTFGIQFIVLLVVLVIFLFILALTEKKIHSPTSMLLKRKKIIFPIRLVTLTFNIILLSSLAQVASVNPDIIYSPLSFAMAILAIVILILILLMVGVVCNWKRFHVDDPHYFVLLQQMTSKKWFAKNNILFSLLTRTIMISIYVGLYSNPEVSGILIIIMQTIYTVYFIALLRFTKLRYFLFKTLSNVILIGTLTVTYVGSVSEIGGANWQNSSTAYVLFLLGHLLFYFIITVMEIIFNRQKIVKYLKSFYQRFIKCESIDQKIQMTRYDQDSHRQKVKEFHANLLFQKEMPVSNSIQMTSVVAKP